MNEKYKAAPEHLVKFHHHLWQLSTAWLNRSSSHLVDHLTVNAKDDIVFTMVSGMEIKA